MEISPPIHLLPNELLVQIIEKLPRTQWPALELIDKKFRDAVELAWGSLREVNMVRDFIYTESKAIEGEIDDDSVMVKLLLRRQIARKTEAILKKLSERSPFITSLILALITDDPILNTTAVQYLSEFEHLETIKFAKNIPSINFIEFMESTQSRATLKEILIDEDEWDIPDDPITVANFDQRLRAAFANVSNDPTRQSLRLKSISMRFSDVYPPFTFCDIIDASQLTKLSLGDTPIEPAALTNLINGAPRLQHIDFAFLESCRDTRTCDGRHRRVNKDLLAALESRPNLTSLEFNSIWLENNGCTCSQFGMEFKKMLRTIAPQLVNFDFHPKLLPPGISMSEICDIIQHHMPQLKSIACDDVCCAENPYVLRGIADGKELEEIEIVIWSRNTDSNLLPTILSKSPRLKKFYAFNYCPDQRGMAELCKLTDLIDLRIDADQLFEEDYVAFSQHVFAEKLEVLHLVKMREGVESGLIELIGKAAQLRELMVHQNVTDRLLESLAESCPNLQKLRALSANGMTLAGVRSFVDRCPNLRSLFVEMMDPYRKVEFEL